MIKCIYYQLKVISGKRAKVETKAEMKYVNKRLESIMFWQNNYCCACFAGDLCGIIIRLERTTMWCSKTRKQISCCLPPETLTPSNNPCVMCENVIDWLRFLQESKCQFNNTRSWQVTSFMVESCGCVAGWRERRWFSRKLLSQLASFNRHDVRYLIF